MLSKPAGIQLRCSTIGKKNPHNAQRRNHGSDHRQQIILSETSIVRYSLPGFLEFK
jgi:hypothetical protein